VLGAALTALFSCLTKGLSMRAIALTTLVALYLFTQPAQAADIEDDPNYRIGDEACTNMLDKPGFEIYAEAVGGDPSTFCACVGTQFVENEPLQSFRIDMAVGERETTRVFAEILDENMSACFPQSDDDDDVIDGDLVGAEGYDENFADGYQDGPNWSAMPDQANCEFAIDGLLEPANFDRDYIGAWLVDSGLGAEDLCFCAAAVMEDHADEFATEFEATRDPDLYWSYMSRSVDQCQTAMWKR
jgi:hypothetical protein